MGEGMVGMGYRNGTTGQFFDVSCKDLRLHVYVYVRVIEVLDEVGI